MGDETVAQRKLRLAASKPLWRAIIALQHEIELLPETEGTTAHAWLHNTIGELINARTCWRNYLQECYDREDMERENIPNPEYLEDK